MDDCKVLFGNTVRKNNMPPDTDDAVLYLNGRYKKRNRILTLSNETLSRHSLIVGGTGSGKTNLFFHIVNQLINQMGEDDVMLIFDTKGDYYREFARSTDYVIGNSADFITKSVRWNIFRDILSDGKNEKIYRMNIQEMCRIFFDKRLKNTTNAFFPNAGMELLGAVLTAIIRDSINDRELRNKYFYNDSFTTLLKSYTPEHLIENLRCHSDLTSVCSYIEGYTEQGQSVLSEMYSVLNEIFVGVFNEHGDFSVREFIRKKGRKILFVEYDLTVGKTLSPLYSLLFDLALKESLGRSHSTGNVYLIADEFKLLPNMQHIEDGVNFGRSMGVKVFAGIQSIAQLYEIYGEKAGKNIAAGFSSVYAFRANDFETRKHISELFGRNYTLERYTDLEGEYKEEKHHGYAVEDWDMLSLELGEAIIGLPFIPPFRFCFNKYIHK